MKELLSNEEIDTLLDLFRSEGAPIEEAQQVLELDGRSASGPMVSTVDLLKPNRFSRDQMRTFDRIFSGCAKGLAVTMSDKLRFDMSCDCVGVEQLRFQSWLRTVSGVSVVYVLKMPPFEGLIPLTVTSSLLYGAVDRILGGSGRVQAQRQEFTAAEFTVADAFVMPCLDRLCQSLGDLGTFTWEIEARHCNPGMVQVVPSQDVVLSVHIQVSSEFMPGDLRLAIPHAALEPMLKNVEFSQGSPFRVAPGSMRETTAATVRQVPLDIAVQLGRTEVPLRQLLALEVGDVVTLPTRVGTPLVAPVQGRPKFTGQIGKRGRQLAFRVGGVVESETMTEQHNDAQAGAATDIAGPVASEIQTVEFGDLGPPSPAEGEQNLDLLLDVSIPISVEVGRAEMSLAEILDLVPGSIVGLDKKAEEPVDLRVNGKLVARGEVVLVDDSYGIRVTQIVDPAGRIESLRRE